MTDCDRCGEHCLDCKCHLVELHLPHDIPIPPYEERIKSLSKELQKDQIKVNKLERFKQAGLIGCLNTDCHKTGCRSLETRCKDCGRTVNSTEIPTNQGNSGWTKVQDSLPQDYEYVLVHAEKEQPHPIMSIARQHDGVWEMLNHSPESNAVAWDLTWYMDESEITHWMPLPESPKE